MRALSLPLQRRASTSQLTSRLSASPVRSSPCSRVFLALALFNLDQPEEAEETYKKAIEQSPSQPLARQVCFHCLGLESASRQADPFLGWLTLSRAGPSNVLREATAMDRLCT